jgi:hypothetical protein
MHRMPAALALPFVLNGCAAVLVGGLFYHDSKTRDQRLAFTGCPRVLSLLVWDSETLARGSDFK